VKVRILLSFKNGDTFLSLQLQLQTNYSHPIKLQLTASIIIINQHQTRLNWQKPHSTVVRRN